MCVSVSMCGGVGRNVSSVQLYVTEVVFRSWMKHFIEGGSARTNLPGRLLFGIKFIFREDVTKTTRWFRYV